MTNHKQDIILASKRGIKEKEMTLKTQANLSLPLWLQKAIRRESKELKITSSTLVQIILSKYFIGEEFNPFNE